MTITAGIVSWNWVRDIRRHLRRQFVTRQAGLIAAFSVTHRQGDHLGAGVTTRAGGFTAAGCVLNSRHSGDCLGMANRARLFATILV